MAEAITAMISIVSFLAYLTYMFYSTRNKERMALIESGQDAGIFRTTPSHYSALKWGILMVSLGIGVGLGVLVDLTMDNDGPIATIPMVFIFGGLGLLLYYRIMKNEDWDK